MAKIEILHTRDPDSSCDFTVWIDGEEVTGQVSIEDVDPGRGYSRADWNRRIADNQADTTSSPAFKQAVRLTLLDSAGSSYIEGEDDERPTSQCGCGYELIWIDGCWEHDAAPSLWGNDHEPHAEPPDADTQAEWASRDAY